MPYRKLESELKRETTGHPPSGGQSLLEVAIFFPILLMMLSGVVEFGFLLNGFLNLLDGPREGARFAVSQQPFTSIDYTTDMPDFYINISNEVKQAIKPMVLDPTRDDVVISIFSVQGSTVNRYPNAGNLTGESVTDTTVGEWHLYGRGSGCTVDVDLDCHPSRFSNDAIAARVTQTAVANQPPAIGVVLVELYYSYDQVLKLPWLAFIGDPVRLYTFTMMPVTGATPTQIPN